MLFPREDSKWPGSLRARRENNLGLYPGQSGRFPIVAPMSSKARRWIGLTAVGLGLLFLGIFVRDRLGIDLDPESIRTWVLDAGPVAPLLCVAMVALRSVIGLPSQVVLIVSGLAFGVFWGTVYGALGLEISGLVTFQLARMAGRDAVHRKIPERLRPVVARAGERPGALFIAVGTGYPIGVLTAYHALAGVTAMGFGVFASSLAVGAVVRAGTYAYFGNSLMAGDFERLLLATGLILALLALPLLFPRGRALLLRVVMGGDPAQPTTGSASAEDSAPTPP